MTHKLFKQECSIKWTTAGLRVELHAKEWLTCMRDTFIGQVIGIQEKRFPSVRESVCVNGKTMVLWGDVTPTITKIDSWLVHASITVLQLISICSCRQ